MTGKMVEAYLKALESEERAAATFEKYRRALLSCRISVWCGGHAGDN